MTTNYEAILNSLRDEEHGLRARLAVIEVERAEVERNRLNDELYGRIVPPDTGAYPGIGTATVSGVDLVFANWQNYQGWEVRERRSSAASPGRVIGYTGGACKSWWVSKTQPLDIVKSTDQQCPSFGAALAYLVANR